MCRHHDVFSVGNAKHFGNPRHKHQAPDLIAWREEFKMPSTCCVIYCNSRSHDRSGLKLKNGISFYRFPAWKNNSTSHVSEVTKRRRMAWIAAVRRPKITFDNTPPHMMVCSKHFHKGKLQLFSVNMILWANNQRVLFDLAVTRPIRFDVRPMLTSMKWLENQLKLPMY